VTQTFTKDDWFGLVLCKVHFNYISHHFGLATSQHTCETRLAPTCLPPLPHCVKKEIPVSPKIMALPCGTWCQTLDFSHGIPIVEACYQPSLRMVDGQCMIYWTFIATCDGQPLVYHSYRQAVSVYSTTPSCRFIRYSWYLCKLKFETDFSNAVKQI